MSDYSDKEESLEESQPFELYEWVGTFANYYMTSDSISHEFQGRTFLPVPGLKRSENKIATHEEDSIDMTVTIPISEQVAQDYAFQITPPILNLTIYRRQRSAPTGFAQYWKGPISSIRVDLDDAIFRSDSTFGRLLQTDFPTLYMQPPCNNVLFDERCKVSRAANSIATTVSIVSGRQITVASLGVFPAGFFIGGEVALSARNERRMIVDQSGTLLTVNYEFSRIGNGTAVQVAAGCDHSFNGANGCPKFANQLNFVGFPYMPGESNNPYQNGVS